MFQSVRMKMVNDHPELAGDERVYAIGDIHGRFDLMMRMLNRIAADGATFEDGRRVRLVFLGDYIDRGDDARAVLDVIASLKAVNPDAVICLLGNHEDALLEFLRDPVENPGWLDFGAEQTLASYGVPSKRRPNALERSWIARTLAEKMGGHLALLKAMGPIFQSGDVIFSHAGYDPLKTARTQDKGDLIWGNDAFLCDAPAPGLCFVHGHHDGPRPVHLKGRICVDTGAYYSGVLTAVRLDKDVTFLSVTMTDQH